MIVLGIESSCDDTGAAVLRDGHELANVVASTPGRIAARTPAALLLRAE